MSHISKKVTQDNSVPFNNIHELIDNFYNHHIVNFVLKIPIELCKCLDIYASIGYFLET